MALIRRVVQCLPILLRSHRLNRIDAGINRIMSRYMTSEGKGNVIGDRLQGPSTNQPALLLNEESVSGKTCLDFKDEDPLTTPQEQPAKPQDPSSPTKVDWWEWLKKPLIGGVSTIVFGVTWLMYDSKTKVDAVDKMIENGTRPYPSIEDPIDRRDIVEEIKNTFIVENSEDFQFGIIIGPTGTGKTHLIKEACRQSPQGALYLEMGEPKAYPKELAKAIGMRIEPTVMSSVLGKHLESFHGYYKLPSHYDECVNEVLGCLAERALVFKQKYNRPPCLFIDGVDLLAKRDKQAFVNLVNLAKKHANDGTLRIVFGCSEGHIMTLVRGTSSQSRRAILEILDLLEDEATGYLVKNGVPKELADQLVKAVGCRMIFLQRSIGFYNRYMRRKPDCSIEEAIGEIKHQLEILFVDQGEFAIGMGTPESIDIIKHLMKFDSTVGFLPVDFLKGYFGVDRTTMGNVLDSLVNQNALRYTAERKITWHNKMIKEKVMEKYIKKN